MKVTIILRRVIFFTRKFFVPIKQLILDKTWINDALIKHIFSKKKATSSEAAFQTIFLNYYSPSTIAFVTPYSSPLLNRIRYKPVGKSGVCK